MTEGIDQLITQNLAALTMAVLFLWYINKRDKIVQEVFDKFADRIDRLTNAIAKLERGMAHVEDDRANRMRNNEATS